MSASAGTGVFVFSLTSIPICYLCNSLICNDRCLQMFHYTYFILTGCCFAVYAVFAFLSVVNLIIGLEQDNIIDGFVTFYLKEADPHINTAHGHMISYWDGCVHYLMYLLVIAAITWGDSYRSIGLYWVGSFLMRAIVYILGNTVGLYNQKNCNTDPNSNYIVIVMIIMNPVDFCFQETQRKRLSQRPTDMLFVIYLIPAFAFCVFRGLIALDCSGQWCQDYALQFEPYLKDPTAYPKVQMLVSLLYSGPYYFLALYALIVPGCGWMPDLTLVHSGALAQAQFSHIGASLHTRTPFSFRVPLSSQPLFLLVNVIYALVPQLLCYRCSTQPEFFLSTRTTSDKKTE
uniref:Transmembrane 6 superfamily member 1 n=1 Tax=Periophthalmus magnuspinnatus TaxID=409849 RepID=A0A3B3Z8H1_9GOBI